MWNRPGSHQCTALRDVRVLVRLGVYPEERAAPQPVSIDVELYRPGGRFTGTELADCLDYDRVFRYLTATLPSRPHTDLLELLAEDLVQFCLGDPRVAACRIVVRKTAIYHGRGVPEVIFFRERSA